MKNTLPPYVYRIRGIIRYQRRGRKGVRFETQWAEGKPTPDEFWGEYQRIQKGITPAPVGKTFTALVASYMRSEKYSRLKVRTRKDYDQHLEYIARAFPTQDPSKLRRVHAVNFRDTMPFKAHRRNYTIRVLRILFEHAIDKGWREDNPCKGVGEVHYDKQERGPWSEDMVQAFRDATEGRTLLLFELLLGTGQRIGDVLKMRWNEYDGLSIRVSQSKTGAQLIIPVTRNLKAQLDIAPKEGMTILTSAHQTTPWAYRGASDAIMKVRKEIGATDHTIHDLRHTAASELAALGLDDQTIMAVTGHTSVASVARYAKNARQITRAEAAQKARDRT